MKCLIVEDELPAVKVLENHIGFFNDLEIVGVFHNAMDALVYLQKNQVDLLFLDIQLPKMTGMQFLNALNEKPHVILTTAYREFALDGYELNVTDYLLKPISFDRFSKALTRAYEQSKPPTGTRTLPNNSKEKIKEFMFVSSDREYVKIYFKDILYIESVKNQIKIVANSATHTTLMGIGEIEDKLSKEHFIRVHRSFIVSISHITKFTHNHLNIGDKIIPIGRHYKKEFSHWSEKQIM